MEDKKEILKEIWISRDGKEWIFYSHCISSMVTDMIKKLENKGFSVKAVNPNDKSSEGLRKKLNVIPHKIE